ncbi:hypothetical protein D187_003668 [Cystobacter fuscus DSM 2262]|uniref:histidine kinase n=1 Tax=Cystobacter fuscus (strain ATCC 25194 / DSM 2262 / NBRC 100088 / M29) TaxID=1242864 RepID=S9P8X5_CYSF2|nr:ATP-binding protein [Cystobacter fuscus]EPX58707.1 hypothetical protein D187_003668 [Cystobacter fuscus DSM 2262]
MGYLWLTSLLDAFLSDALRKAPPSELHRQRVLIAACLFALPFGVSYLLLVPFTAAEVPTLLLSGCYAATLLLARRARSLTVPAMFMCLSMVVSYVVSIFLSSHPEGGFHASSMLIPAFAVYLLGPRLGLFVTGCLAVCLGLLHPMYRVRFTPGLTAIPLDEFTVMCASAAVSLLGSWVLSTLHSTSRDTAHDALERTLATLRESEGKLSSLIESSDDLVFSLDTQLRVITANTAMRQFYRRMQGQELVPGRRFCFPRTPELQLQWDPRFNRVLAGERLRFEQEEHSEEPLEDPVHVVLDISISPIVGEQGRVMGLTVSARDITARKLAEARLGEMHRSLVDVSRYAGMAEVATGVLHNVGNTLNSVNISAGILNEQLRHSRLSGLRKAATLLGQHSEELESFLATDARGQRLPGYLLALAEELEKEREVLRHEVGALSEGIEHIKSIVVMQQQYARAGGVLERLPVPQLIEEALRLHAGSIERQGIHLVREYADVPPILVDRHNLLQILVNLLSNARHALMESKISDKRLRIRIRLGGGGDQLVIEFSDNGVGIAPEHLARLFSQGFTTKKHGHGFGLHISALAATEMHGRLSCSSTGLGHGATFTLVLPVEGPRENQRPSHSLELS